MSDPRALRALTAPGRLYARTDLRPRGAIPPSEPGLYAWYFDGPVGEAPLKGCHQLSGHTLMYVGIAPSGPSSGATLRSRVRQHFRGNAAASTLRKTLACLLGFELRRIGPSERIRLRRRDEEALSDWMADHARVCWVVHPRPWDVESGIVRALDLPLNLEHNEGHPFHARLRALRREAMADARRRPALARA